MKKVIIRYKDFALRVHISEDCTTIYDSYKIKSPWDMRIFLRYIQNEAPSKMAIHKRSLTSMIDEWRTHNLLYSLGIMRDRTKSTDLNVNQPWYIKVLYTLVSPFYFHFS